MDPSGAVTERFGMRRECDAGGRGSARPLARTGWKR